jgi:hypothetical protein
VASSQPEVEGSKFISLLGASEHEKKLDIIVIGQVSLQLTDQEAMIALLTKEWMGDVTLHGSVPDDFVMLSPSPVLLHYSHVYEVASHLVRVVTHLELGVSLGHKRVEHVYTISVGLKQVAGVTIPEHCAEFTPSQDGAHLEEVLEPTNGVLTIFGRELKQESPNLLVVGGCGKAGVHW